MTKEEKKKKLKKKQEEKQEIIGIETKEMDKWEVENAVRTLEEYKKIMKNKELKAKAIKLLKEKAKEYKDLSEEIN